MEATLSGDQLLMASGSLRTTPSPEQGASSRMASKLSGSAAPNTRPSKWVSAVFLTPQRLMLACSTLTRLAEYSFATMPPWLFIKAAI